jgi:hypothetical protein
MFKNLVVGIDWRQVEPALNVLPVDDFVSVSCNRDYALHFPVSNDWRKIWFDCILIERSSLLDITCFQVFDDDAFYSRDPSFQPEFSFAQNSTVITRAENVVLVVPDVVCACSLAILTLRHTPPEWGRQHATQIGAPRVWVVPFKGKKHRSCLNAILAPDSWRNQATSLTTAITVKWPFFASYKSPCKDQTYKGHPESESKAVSEALKPDHFLSALSQR